MGKLIFILIFVGIGIIRKLAEDAAKKRQKRAADEVVKMPKDKRANVQSEIEAFLQGVTGQKPAAAANRPRRKARSQRRQQRPEQAEQKRRAQERARAEAEQRARAEKSRSGSTLSEHVNQYIGQHVDQHIGHGIDEEIPIEVVNEAATGPREKSTAEVTASSVNIADITAMLRSPGGMQQALIASEILARPRSLRR